MRVACLLIALLSVAVVLGSAHAQDSVIKGHDHGLMLHLRKTEHLLLKGRHDYKGHRVKAIKQIKEAIEHLKKEAQLQGFKGPGPVPKIKEPQWESNKQLHRAIKELRHVHWLLEKKGVHTPLRDKARQHIHHAIKELETALKVAPTKKKPKK